MDEESGTDSPGRDRDTLLPPGIGVVLRDVGGLQVLVGAIMVVPAVVGLVYQEYRTALAFLASAAVVAPVGALLHRGFRDAPDPGSHHAMVIAGLGWLVSALSGALPIFLAAHLTPIPVMESMVPPGASYGISSLIHFRNPLHAVFEAMSGFTTTGLTMSVHEPSLPRGLLLWRSLMQWVGGVGVIVLALAIIRHPGGTSGLSLYRSEARQQKVRPTILGTARAIWRVYVVLTAIVAVYLAGATFLIQPGYGVEPTLFDAVNHAMTGMATGGFSTLDDSIAGYGSVQMELVHVVPMMMGALAIPLYYRVWDRRDVSALWRDPQARWLFILFGVGTAVLSALLLVEGGPVASVRDGLFQYVSAQSGTGWQTADVSGWAGAPIGVAVVAMVIGGSAGATVGGIKIIRAYLFGVAVRWRVTRVFLPRSAVESIRVGDRRMPADAFGDELAQAMVVAALFVVVLVGGVVLTVHFAGPGTSLALALFESTSAQATVGLSTGLTGPGMSPVVEVVFIVQMWAGRLEIIPVLVLLRAVFGGR